MNRTGALLMLLAFTGGCAGSFGAVRSAVDEAPDWFKDRQTEIRGEGYPDLAGLPASQKQPVPEFGQGVEQLSPEEALRIREEFLSSPRAEPVMVTVAEIEARAAELASVFDGIDVPGGEEFKTPDTDVFDRIPPRQGPRAPKAGG